ncbi:MAG TPA: transglycosylase SLT domain-containing protein [Candidatus Thiothrix moscowensis]|uniref:transglycosylase SLT domain-containing protein n=1 Tax=unclassified Thiothrix TaxID=2636184 RepID=UPI0025EB4586|nr:MULTISPECIES: transglycosylase SLT domain-containing protein [unclassified Thiothrix]HRJ51138.1 transglycosylase SLT domain-containing protein [Candidatus Thiothrix moscowensis]HRJ91807.1 transglycosylase SLT domain-containing protein [Candidatus Thiothrix moscowensis]
MLPVTSTITRSILLLALNSLLTPAISHANEAAWVKVAYQTPAKPSLDNLAQKHHDLFRFFLDNALHGRGKEDFLRVSAAVRNNITWRNDKGINIYNEAFRRSFAFVKKHDLQGMPDTIMLIPYMESQWHGHKGEKDGDYGYWQLIPEVITEIQTLDYVTDALKTTNIDKLRADAELSTQAAQVHLHRYHFYFAKVARFPEADAWLLTFTAFNWGAGNVKRLLADMQNQGQEISYANFYHNLYAAHLRNPADISLKAAVEYVPKLWNIAQLLHKSN